MCTESSHGKAVEALLKNGSKLKTELTGLRLKQQTLDEVLSQSSSLIGNKTQAT